MTELQQAEFDLLKEFIRICNELELSYYLVCGSALGAAKYKGFIPWDDDIDVALPRKDYEVFLEKAQALLPAEVFLQNYHTDPAFPQIFSKLRNSRTTYIEKSAAKLLINHGVYIDVFPLDGYPDDKRNASQLERWKRIYQLQLSCVYQTPCSKKAAVFFAAERMLGYHRRTDRTVKKLEQLLTRYPITDSKLWCNHGNWQGKLEYAPYEQYGHGVWAMFEGLQVRIPAKYDEYLTQKYGDWRADLPDKQKAGHHYYAICDLKRPYTDYIEKLSNGTMRIKKPEELENV